MIYMVFRKMENGATILVSPKFKKFQEAVDYKAFLSQYNEKEFYSGNYEIVEIDF